MCRVGRWLKFEHVLCSKCLRKEKSFEMVMLLREDFLEEERDNLSQVLPSAIYLLLLFALVCKLGGTYSCKERLSHLLKVIPFTSNPGQLDLPAQPWTMEGFAGARSIQRTGHPGRGTTWGKAAEHKGLEQAGRFGRRAACVQGRMGNETRKGGGTGCGRPEGFLVGRIRQKQLEEDWPAAVRKLE